jgi:hypothetical protein
MYLLPIPLESGPVVAYLWLYRDSVEPLEQSVGSFQIKMNQSKMTLPDLRLDLNRVCLPAGDIDV